MQDPGTAACRPAKSEEKRTTSTVRSRIAGVFFMTVLTFLMSSVPLGGGCFPGAAALTACTASASRRNLYLAVPSLLAILLQIRRGSDAYGSLAAVVICGVFFAAASAAVTRQLYTAIIAACVMIISESICRLAGGAVYRIRPEDLIVEGLTVFCLVFIFHIFMQTIQTMKAAVPYGTGSPGDHRYAGSTMLPLTAFASVSIIAFCGTGLDFMVWAFIVFISLWALAYLTPAQAMLVTFIGGVTSAAAGQSQWGILVSLLAGTAAASFFDDISGMAAWRHGAGRDFTAGQTSAEAEQDDRTSPCKRRASRTKLKKDLRIIILTLIYIFTSGAVGSAGDGVILGVDTYTLLTAAAAFTVVNWKAGRKMEEIAGAFAWGGSAGAAGQTYGPGGDAGSGSALQLLADGEQEMAALDELYSTYLDSRSMLANQFELTRQILEKTRRRLSCRAQTGVDCEEGVYRFHADIAASQCAALGGINGDCCGWQDIGDGQIAIVLSDGMGKGKKAASESLMVVRTVLSLLRSGVSADTTLKTINSVMLMKDDGDSFATLDLAIADQRSGRAKFYKIGAAPTLLRRKDHIEEMKLSAVPLGIVNGLKVRYMEATLRRGDWIIMMSDGVSDGGTNRSLVGEISETAAKIRSDNPQVMSDLILDQAADSYALRERDDLTVVVAKLL